MPVIRSAKKKARQAIVHTERNKSTRTMVKTYIKKLLTLSKTNPAEAEKFLPKAYSAIDTACKKHVLHRNNASRKKALLAKTVAHSKKTGAAK